MRQRYLSFIIYHFSFSVALLLAGCAGEENVSRTDTLSGEGKTPLRIEATLSTGSGVTRAAGNEFAAGDQLMAYLRHVTFTTTGTAPNITYPSVEPLAVDWSRKLVTFTKGSEAMKATSDANIYQTSDLTVSEGLYWDDFSQGAKGEETDIRTDNHGLQSYYGYCYNGGSPTSSTTLEESTGVLSWTVPTTYATGTTGATTFKQADLLWSPKQNPVTYTHNDAKNDDHGTLTIPYTHAMSEVTVVVTVDESFTSSNPLAGATVKLKGMNTVASLRAPLGAAAGYGEDASTNVVAAGKGYYSHTSNNIMMYNSATSNSNKTRTYVALVAPGSTIKDGNKLLDITIDGVKYEVNVTSAMLTTDKWAKDHATKTESETNKTYILTQPGVNYRLEVGVGKAQVKVNATIADWVTVTAEGQGHVHYANDVTTTVNGEEFTANSEFSLYRLLSTASNESDAGKRDNSSFGNVATTPKYNATSKKWENTPLIYWTSTTDKYFFRALAKKTDENTNTITNTDATTDVSQGVKDILWGTTPDDATNGYAKGQSISPRSGDVPISFEHALSRVTFKLVTTGSSEDNPLNPAYVNLTNATIAVSNLYTTGTIQLDNGTITTTSKTVDAISKQSYPITNLHTIPQTIGDDAIVTITLSDNTVYKLQLNQCVVTGTTTPITVWEAGKHYEYTITVEKDKVQFRALIKQWEEKEGSGNANLEWD